MSIVSSLHVIASDSFIASSRIQLDKERLKWGNGTARSHNCSACLAYRNYSAIRNCRACRRTVRRTDICVPRLDVGWCFDTITVKTMVSSKSCVICAYDIKGRVLPSLLYVFAFSSVEVPCLLVYIDGR